jgi:hypothetical protein
MSQKLLLLRQETELIHHKNARSCAGCGSEWLGCSCYTLWCGFQINQFRTVQWDDKSRFVLHYVHTAAAQFVHHLQRPSLKIRFETQNPDNFVGQLTMAARACFILKNAWKKTRSEVFFCIARHTPHVTHHTSHFMGHMSYFGGSSAQELLEGNEDHFKQQPCVNIMFRTSHVTRHTSHVTRHTSHVTRHTSHVTRHTSHITRHTSQLLHVAESPVREGAQSAQEAPAVVYIYIPRSVIFTSFLI